MASISLSNERVWVAARWAFFYTCQMILNEAELGNLVLTMSLFDKLKMAALEEVEYLDLRELNDGDCKAMQAALELGIKRIEAGECPAFASPEFYESYKKHVDSLIGLMK